MNNTNQVPSRENGRLISRIKNRWVLGFLTAFLLISLTYYILSRSGSQIVPPFPEEINDSEVVAVIKKARNDLIQNPTSFNWGYYGMLLTAHQFDQDAGVCFREAHRLDPGDSRWPLIMGMAAIKRDPNQGVDMLRKAIAINTWPKYHETIVLLLAEILIERSQFDEAEKLLKDNSFQGANQVRYSLVKAWLALNKGNDVQAREYFSLLRSSPFARRKATAQLAALARLDNDPKEAEKLEKELLDLPEDTDWPDPLIGEIVQLRVGKRAREKAIRNLEEQKRYGDAANEQLKELESDRSLKNLINLGINFSRNKEYGKALRYLYEGVEKDPDSAHARHSLAVCLLMDAGDKILALQRNPEEIEQELVECVRQSGLAIKLKPDHALSCLICGTALKFLGKYQEAIKVLDQGIGIRPESFELHLILSEVYYEMGDYSKARKEIDYCMKIEPSNPRTSAQLELIQKAEMKKQTGMP